MKKLLVPLLLVIVAGACAQGVRPGAQPPSGTPSTNPPSAGASASPVAVGSTEVKIYYLVSFGSTLYLAPERHRVAKTQAIAKRALDELVHGEAQDPDHSTPYPRSATVNSVTIRNKIATVDWSASVLEANAGSDAESLGIQSVVYTLTEFSSISTVRFTVEGKDRGTASNGRSIEDWWGHVGLSGQPWDRDPAIDVLEPITLYTPLDGSTSTGTLKMAGEASTFEANVGIVLRDASGKVVVRTSTTASMGAPDRGTFAKTVAFTPPTTRQTWTLQVIEDSAKDGSVVFMEDRDILVG